MSAHSTPLRTPRRFIASEASALAMNAGFHRAPTRQQCDGLPYSHPVSSMKPHIHRTAEGGVVRWVARSIARLGGAGRSESLAGGGGGRESNPPTTLCAVRRF